MPITFPQNNPGFSLQDVYSGVEDIRAKRQQGSLRDIGIQEAQQKQAAQQSLRELYRQNTDAQGNVNTRAIQAGLAQGGYGDLINPLAKDTGEARQSALKTSGDEYTGIGQLAQGIDPNDPDALVKFKREAGDFGVDAKLISQVPDSASPEEVASLKQQLLDKSMTYKDSMVLQGKKSKLDKMSAAEYKMHMQQIAAGIRQDPDISPRLAEQYLLAGRTTVYDVTSPTGGKTRFVEPTGKLLGGGVSLGKDLSPETKALSKQWEDSNIARIMPAIELLDSYMDKYPNELPGRGNLKNINVATYLLTDEGKELKRATQWLFNTDLKIMSGGAVTDPEAARGEIANALNAASTAEDYRKAYKTLIKPLYKNVFDGMMAGYGKNVQRQFTENSGIDLDAIGKRLSGTKSKTDAKEELRRLLRGQK